MFGKPDFVSKQQKIVMFIDGCFWHKCPKHFKEPKSNMEYWTKKIKRNVARDKEINKHYNSLGWKVIRIWEHKLKGR